jgi:predicted Zn-dependent protease
MDGIEQLTFAAKVSQGAFRRELSEAFAMWERIANITFRETSDEASAGILIGSQAIPEGRAFANVAELPTAEPIRQIDKALVCLNPKAKWKIGFDGDLDIYDLRYTLAHEIGHAIGLDHPAPSGKVMGFKYTETFRTLQPGDAAGAVALYGERPPGTHAGVVVEDIARTSAPVATMLVPHARDLTR